jgi:hypothetical protein
LFGNEPIRARTIEYNRTDAVPAIQAAHPGSDRPRRVKRNKDAAHHGQRSRTWA